MPLDWLNTPLDADIGDLIARKKRAKTIEMLRSQLQGRMVPPVQMRLQLADLLVQAGRAAEAMPVLIGLADEFAGDGFVAKAVAILKRVERIQPGREDVESRLARLVQVQRAAPAAKSSPRPAPEFGIEEIREDAPEPASEPEPAATADAGAEVELPAPAPAAAEAEPGPLVPPPATPPPPAAETETTRRVRGVFRRFLASLPGAGASAEASPAAAEPTAGDTATAPDETVPDDAAVASAPDTVPDAEAIDASYAIVPEPEPEPEAESEPELAPDPEPEAESEPEIEPEPEPIEAASADATDDDDDNPVTARYAVPAADAGSAGPPAPAAASKPVEPAAEAPPPAASGDPNAHGVAGRIRGAFRWLVASLASPEAAPAGVTKEAAAEAPSGPVAEASSAPVAETPSPAAKAATAPDSPVTPPEAAGSAASAGFLGSEEDEEPLSDEMFQERLLDLVQDILRRPGSRQAPLEVAPLDRRLVLRYAQRLLATALFGNLTEEELLAVVRGLRLHLHGPGDILVTEGEPGQSIFILASGGAKVFVRSPSGRNFPVAELREGEFFGEISSLSGRPRSATLTASARCELLELDRSTLDAIARTHPHVADVLEEFYIRRASSPEAAAVRAVPRSDAATARKAIEVLEAHFGQSRWDPRMRLRLADVLLKAGKFQDAVPVLIGLADDLARAGYAEKAIAVLKKIEKIQSRDIEEVNLAPRRGAAPADRRRRGPRAHPDAAPEAVAAAVKPGWGPQPTAEFFQGWLVDVLRDRVKRSELAEGTLAEGERSALGGARGYGPGLMASPLFEDFNDDELLAVIRGLRLLSFDAGDIIITEGEPGLSLFVLTTGTVKVFVRDPSGRNVALVPLGEGAFFGEIATLSGRPRSATVTAASRCELLELDKAALEAILKVHPRVRDVLEEHYIARANDPEAAAIRGTHPQADGSAPGGTR
jgi:CRP-like cAMP-binding protein